VQAPCRVERFAERKQIELVGTAAVVEDEQSVGLAGSRALAEAQRRHRHAQPLRVTAGATRSEASGCLRAGR
jgi:hypothetical protein